MLARVSPSLRAKRSNPVLLRDDSLDCVVAPLLAMTVELLFDISNLKTRIGVGHCLALLPPAHKPHHRPPQRPPRRPDGPGPQALGASLVMPDEIGPHAHQRS